MEHCQYHFGILGCGMIANVHAQAIAHLPEARLLGVTDHNAEIAAKFADRYGVSCYDSYEQMLNDPRIDVVCICTPSSFHAPNAIQALEGGKHVVLEKPMALDSESASNIIAVCEKTGKKLTVISQMRFSEDVRKLKQLLSENAFGKITLCSLSMKYYRSEEYYRSSVWKGTKKFDGGGALMNQGIHGVDLLQYIMGGVQRVQGRIKTLSHHIEVEDTAVAMLEFENGALGVLEASTCAYPGFERRITICGDRGYVMMKEDRIERLMVNGEEISLDIVGELGSPNDPTKVSYERHMMQMQNLLNAVEGKEELVTDACEGRKAVWIIEKIYQEK